MIIEAIIFDRDGVLTDFDMAKAGAFFGPILPISLDELGYHWEKQGKKTGFPTSVAEEKIFFRDLWDHLSDEFELVQSKRAQLHKVDSLSFLQPFPEVRPVLEGIRRRGLRIGVLSNFSLANLDASLEAAGLLDLIDVACAATVIGFAKPEPRAYLTATKALGVKPENCLFFDDETDCVQGGRDVGMQSYLVDRHRPDHAIAEGIVRDLSAIPTILDHYSRQNRPQEL